MKEYVKEYALKTIFVGGEVATPGPVDLGTLPLRGMAVKEMALENGRPAFKGAYFFNGYSLYDVINSKTVKKVNADFFVDRNVRAADKIEILKI